MERIDDRELIALVAGELDIDRAAQVRKQADADAELDATRVILEALCGCAPLIAADDTPTVRLSQASVWRRWV